VRRNRAVKWTQAGPWAWVTPLDKRHTEPGSIVIIN
jgi:hypothetical protein